MSQWRMEAASPKRKPRDSATMVRARMEVSAGEETTSCVRCLGWNQVRAGIVRSLSAAGESFHQMVGTGTVVQPMSLAILMADRVVRTVDPAHPFERSVARYLSTRILSETAKPMVSRKVAKQRSLER